MWGRVDGDSVRELSQAPYLAARETGKKHPLAKVILTGITTVFGPTRALLEVTEQEPGKTAVTRRPTLRSK